MPSPFTFDKTKPADADPLNQGAAQIRTDKTTLANVLGTLQAFGAPTTGWRNTQIGNDMWLTANATYTGTVWNRDDTTAASWAIVMQSTGSYLLQFVAAAANPITWTTLFTLTTAGALTIAGGLTIAGVLAGATGFPPTITLKKGTGSGNYTTISTTYVRVDTTNLVYAVTVPVGQKITIAAAFSTFGASSGMQIGIALADGTADNTGILTETEASSVNTSSGQGNGLVYVLVGDGTLHTFNLQFKSPSAATATMKNTSATFTPMMMFWMGQAN